MKENTLQLFKTMTPKAYANATALFTGSKAGDNQELFYNWIANTALLYAEHRDATHLNRAVLGAKSRGYAFVAVAKKLNAHAYNATSQTFGGKMSKSKMDSLMNVDDKGVTVFEAIVFQWVQGIADKIAQDSEPKEKAKLTAEKAQLKVDNTFESLAKEGFTLEQVIAMFNQAAIKYSKPITK